MGGDLLSVNDLNWPVEIATILTIAIDDSCEWECVVGKAIKDFQLLVR